MIYFAQLSCDHRNTFMATLNDRYAFAGQPDDAGNVVIAPVPAERRHEALSMLLTGQPRSSRPAVDQFLGSPLSQSSHMQQLWGAFDQGLEGDVLASLLLIPSPGRTAITFVSPSQKEKLRPVAAELARTALLNVDTDAIHLAQALLDPDQRHESHSLEDAGFIRLAHLVYMQRPTEPCDANLELDPDMAIHHWSDGNRDLFARAILASYEQTADCPGLIGMRDINDIIDGHQATGQFEPNLWTVITRGQEVIGVLLLNRVQNQQGMEIVYLGLAQRARGLRLGRRLVTHAVGTAHTLNLKSLVLAVDELNQPAMTLYRKMGFVASARKLAMIRSLRK